MSINYERIGFNIRRCRKNAGMTQRVLAEKVGCTPEHFSHIEKGSRKVQWKPLSLQKNERSPVEWIEWQAHVGSQCLQVPCTLLRRRMTEELDGIHNLQLHMGYKLQVIGKSWRRNSTSGIISCAIA